MDPALQELLRTGARDESLAAILRIDAHHPLSADLRVVVRFGDIATVRVRRGDVTEAYASDSVASLKATRLLMPEPLYAGDGDADTGGNARDTAVDLPGATPSEAAHSTLASAHDSAPEPSRDQRRQPHWPSGRGVIVASMDWGLDFTHPEFRHRDGRTRLLTLWDQSAPYDAVHPHRYGYGRIHDRAAIDRALLAADPFAALGYDPRRSDRGTGTHGTHVMAIAAGNGRAGGPPGIAPDATLAFVHLSTSGGASGHRPLTDSAAVLEALDFIDRAAGKRMACINMSLGTHGGPHDGSSLVEQGIDAFLHAAPRRILVQSTGNYFSSRVHASGQLQAGDRVRLPVLIDRDDSTANDVEVWYRGSDELRVRLRAPDDRVMAVAALGDRAVVRDDDVEIGRLYHRRGDPNNGDHHVVLNLDAPAAVGRWTLELEALRISDGRYHAWIERDTACAACQPLFPQRVATGATTTGSICNGRGSIVVGAYDAHGPDAPLARFSSSGPTRDGRAKPDLVAPGVRVLSARSTPRHPSARPPLLVRMSGTSMAAPHVTGAAALLCAAAGGTLSAQRVRALLCDNARRHPTPDAADRLRSGAGLLDIGAALAALHASLAIQPPGFSARPASARRPQTLENTMESAHSQTGCSCAENAAARSDPASPRADAEQVVEAVDALEAFDVSTAAAESNGAEGSDTEDDGAEVEYVVRKRTRSRDGSGYRYGGPIIAPVIGGAMGIGAAVLAPIGRGVSIALPLGGLATAPAPTAPTAAPAAPSTSTSSAPADPWKDPAVAIPQPDEPPVSDAPVTVASSEPSVAEDPAATSEAAGLWQVDRRDALQAAESVVAEQDFVAGTSGVFVPSSAGLPDTAEATRWPAAEAAGTDDRASAGAEVDAFDELAEAAVEADPLQDAARFVVELLMRAGLGNLSNGFDEHALAASRRMPARLFDHFCGRRPGLSETLARSFQAVALPGDRLPALAAGDCLLRRGEGGFGHVAVLAAPQVWGRQALHADRFVVESGRDGGFVHVIEPGHRASRRADRFARRICTADGRVPADTLVLRPRPMPAPAWIESDADETVDGRWIQDALNRTIGAGLTVDGQTGPRTRAAIRQFQGQHGLTADGVVGPLTEAALRGALASGGGASSADTGRSGLALYDSGSGSTPGGGVAAGPVCTVLDGFAQGRDALTPAHQTLLIDIARRIQRDRVRLVQITGFASSEGGDVDNLVLGERRAVKVVTALRDTLERIRPGSSSGVALLPLSRGAGDQIDSGDRVRNRRVSVCLLPVAPPAPPQVPAQTRVFTVTGKSFIAHVGSNRGSLDCGIDIGPIRIPGASNAGLFALATATDAAYSEDPHDDRIFSAPPPVGKGYRMFSQGQVQAHHRGDQLLGVILAGGLITDSGLECALPTRRACLTPPPLIIDQPFVTQRIDASRIRFRWGVKGRPASAAEPSFQAICLRDSVFIWHVIKGVVDATGGTPRITSLVIEGSRFPSHRAWLDNVVRGDVPQGPMSNLWNGAPADPTRVQ